MNSHIVFAQSGNYSYPTPTFLFRPSILYPEYPFSELSEEYNNAYELLRNAFILGGYDKEKTGTKYWNPLRNIVHPGDTVLIKPNLVMDCNRTGDGVECLFTQPGLIAAVVDYIIIAFQNKKGEIIIGDAPMQECNFEKLVQESGLDRLVDFYKNKGYKIKLVDFRGLKSTVIRGMHHQEIIENPNGTIINLGGDSEFSQCEEDKLKRLRITNYDCDLLWKHHNNKGKHEYYISNYLLSADVVFNMPKPKTHRKAGITGALKNMVGVNVRKEFLPHHTMGAKDIKKGDEYKKKDMLKAISSFFKDKQNQALSNKKNVYAYLLKNLSRIFFYTDKLFCADHFSQGSWYGNETISKTICDLNKILLYADKNGIMHSQKQRKIFIVADMIVSGEKEGPVFPSPKNVGIVGIGENSTMFDECLASIMGVLPTNIPTIRLAKEFRKKYQLFSYNQKAIIISNNNCWNNKNPNNIKEEDSLMYIPSSGWKDVFFSTKK